MKTASQNACRAAMGGMAIALATAGCAVLAPHSERWTAPPPGASWEIAQRSTGSYGRDAVLQVTRGDGSWQGAPVVTLANSLGMTTMTQPNGHWAAIVGRDGKAVMSWDPPLGFDYPLSVGKSWITPYRMTIGASGRTIAYDLSCKVGAYEKVTVKAGTFDAFRIDCSTTIGNEETYWTRPDMGVFIKTSLRRTDRNPFGAGTQEVELVSVPTVRR